MRQSRFLVPSLLSMCCLSALGQAVISTQSGVINFSEGSVFVDNQALDQKPGSFPSVKEGSILRTEGGRAEILLTPGVVLRIDENSSFRMLTTSISDTGVELLNGSAIVDSKDAAETNGVTVTFKSYQIRFPERGVYRLNSEPGVLQAYAGRAEVTGDGHAAVAVGDSAQFFFDIGMKTDKLGDGTVDGFSEWARGRSEIMTADNAATAASSGDPGDVNNDGAYSLGDPGSYSGAPSLGVPGVGAPGYGSLSGIGPLRNGWYSAYPSPYPFLTPPYGQPPLIVILGGGRYGRSPYRSGYPTWSATGRPRPLPISPLPVRPVYPFPSRTYTSGAYLGGRVNRPAVRPSAVLPARPVMIRPSGHR